MAYDEHTADRFRTQLAGLEGISEKRMMGGVCFLLNGNMIGGADLSKEGQRRFMFRVGKANHDEALTLPNAEPMQQGGRNMSGFFFVDEEATNQAELKQWVSLAVSHSAGLPAK